MIRTILFCHEIRLTSWYGIYHIYPIIYRVSYMLGGGDRRIAEPSTVVKWVGFFPLLGHYGCGWFSDTSGGAQSQRSDSTSEEPCLGETKITTNQPTKACDFFKVTFLKKVPITLDFCFLGDVFYGLYRKSPFFTTVWEKIFGTFLKATYVNPFQTLNQHTSATHSSTKQPTTIININI